jgi:hypothetical protein
MDDQEAVKSLLEHIIGKTIVEVGVDNDEFILYIEDGTKIILYSDEDLNLYYELPEKTH